MKEYSDKLLRTPRILVTGKPGIGKTSLIKDISKEINKIRIGGFYTEEIRRNGTRVGFKFVSFSGESRLLASIEPIGKLKVGKYYLVESLDILGEVKEDIMKADMIIMDEIGPMELKIGELREIIYEGLALEKFVLATVHRSVRLEGKLYELDRFNTQKIKSEILQLIKEYFGSR